MSLILLSADAKTDTVQEAVTALFDGLPRRVTARVGQAEVSGVWTIWEIYRSVATRSIRIRFSEAGRVYHFNSHDVEIEPL